MSNNEENKQEKKVKQIKQVNDEDLDIDDDSDENKNEIKEAKEIKDDDLEENEEKIDRKEIESSYYMDGAKKVFNISSTPFIHEISIINVKNNIPPNRCYLAVEYSKENNSIICIGGSDDKCNQYNKITEYDISNNIWNFWKCEEQSETGLELSGHSSNLINLNDEEKIFIFGGYDNWKQEFTAQSYLVDIKMKNFEKINYYSSYDNNNELPLPRTYHSSNFYEEEVEVKDEDKDEDIEEKVINKVILIYGGTDMNINHLKEDNFQSLWKFDLSKRMWYKINLEIKSPQINHDGPPRGHTSVLLNDKLYIFGGVTSFKKFQNSLHIINLKEKYIELIDYNKESFKKGCIPEPLAFHSAVLLNDKTMFIHGGLDKRYNATNTCYIYHINEMKFDKISIDLIPNLFGHKVVMNPDKNKLYIIGGLDNFKYVGNESLIYKIEREQDNIFNKGKVEFFPMKNILEISLNKESLAGKQYGETPEHGETRELGETPEPGETREPENKNKKNDENSNKNIRWKKLFYANIN